MKLKLARALLVLTVFALLAVLALTGRYLMEMWAPPPPEPSQAGEQDVTPSAQSHAKEQAAQRSASPVEAKPRLKIYAPPAKAPIFLNSLRQYLAFALVTPAILYLARRVPLLGRRRLRALAFHTIVPVAGSFPFGILSFALTFPSWTAWTQVPWSRVVVLESVVGGVFPVYWLLLGVGTALQFSRDHAANALRELELRRSLAAAQLDALKMQLQPHFLFNTLNAVASLAQGGDTDAVVRVVEHLGTLLRLSMEMSARQLVALDEELALIDAYLAIEEVRFGERLRVVRRIAPDARRALVPNLILQPLVENALVHGLSGRLDASLLEIAARREGTSLHIAVRDDGPGVPAGWSLAANAGAGLRNVRDRIQRLFPGACGFQVENGATGGAVARLSIPFADAETTAMAGSVTNG